MVEAGVGISGMGGPGRLLAPLCVHSELGLLAVVRGGGLKGQVSREIGRLNYK